MHAVGETGWRRLFSRPPLCRPPHTLPRPSHYCHRELSFSNFTAASEAQVSMWKIHIPSSCLCSCWVVRSRWSPGVCNYINCPSADFKMDHTLRGTERKPSINTFLENDKLREKWRETILACLVPAAATVPPLSSWDSVKDLASGGSSGKCLKQPLSHHHTTPANFCPFVVRHGVVSEQRDHSPRLHDTPGAWGLWPGIRN